MLNTALTVLVIFLTVLIGLNILGTLFGYLFIIISRLSSWFDGRNVIEEPEEDEDMFMTGKYDVYAYRQRMEKMKEMMDEDGLYNIPDNMETTSKKTDFTGVEIVSNSREIAIDKRVD